jgi:hypothetical protein
MAMGAGRNDVGSPEAPDTRLVSSIADAYWPDVSRNDIEAGIRYYNQVMIKA